MASPEVTILLPFRDNWDLTRRCLESLKASTPEGLYELVLLDNASTGSADKELGCPSIRFQDSLSFARIMNLGMKQAKGRFVVWLNNDTVLSPGWLEGLLKTLRSDPAAAAAGPMTDHMAPPGQIEGPAGSVPFLGGFCFLVRREAVEKVGLLDERFEWGWEDMDYCLRLRQAGCRLILAGDVFVAHAGGGTLQGMAMAERKRTDLANRRLMLEKWLYAEPFRTDLRELFSRLTAPWDNYRPKVSVIVRGASERRLADAQSCEVLSDPSLSLNELIRRAQGDHLVILDPESVPSPGWLEKLLRAAASEKDAGVFGPASDGVKLSWQRRSSAGEGVRRVPYLRSLCLLIPRRVLERVGLLDERFERGMMCEDYCLRVQQAGLGVFLVEDSFVSYSGSWADGDKDARLFFEKWAGHPSLCPRSEA